MSGCTEKLSVQRAEQDTSSVLTKPPINGSRIAWDYSTLKKVSALNTALYNGYARVIQLKDKTLICVYEEDGSVVAVKSSDLGNIWAGRIIIAGKQSHINMAVPDVLELRDGSLLVCYNPRPFNIDPSRRFAIRTKKAMTADLAGKTNACFTRQDIHLTTVAGSLQLYNYRMEKFNYSLLTKASIKTRMNRTYRFFVPLMVALPGPQIPKL
ncbi:MAG: hypothetical protein WKG06_21345 [Segetibacter sp.]